jgi:hypothetical protein
MLLPTTHPSDLKLSIRCSLLPRVLAQMNLYDPYRWISENGIEIAVSKENFPKSSIDFLDLPLVDFSTLQYANAPVPVTLKVVYKNQKPKDTYANKVKHSLNVRRSGVSTASTVYESISVAEVPEYATLSESAKKEFGTKWYAAALQDIEKVYNTQYNLAFDEQKLLDEVVKTFRVEHFICTIDGSVSCRLTTEGNPAESVLYYSMLKNTVLGSKLVKEIETRMFPFVAKGSEFQKNCTNIQTDPNCSSWSEMSVYQYPVCPINEFVTAIKDASGKSFYLKYGTNMPNFRPSREMIRSIDEKLSKVPYDSTTSETSNAIYRLDRFCSRLLSDTSMTKADFDAYLSLYDKVAFRGAAVYGAKGTAQVMNLANIEESLYNSYMFTPYRYHFVQDGEELKEALFQGFSRERLESSSGYSYNLYATMVSLYLMQGKYAE